MKKFSSKGVLDMKPRIKTLVQILVIMLAATPFSVSVLAAEDPCEGSYCDQNPTAEECLQCPERPGCPGGGDGGDQMDITLSE